MIITLIAIILAFIPGNHASDVVIIPSDAGRHDIAEDGVFAYCLCDECCHAQAVKEFADEFTALFNSYETKVAKNGAMMIRQGNSGSFKFARKGN